MSPSRDASSLEKTARSKVMEMIAAGKLGPAELKRLGIKGENAENLVEAIKVGKGLSRPLPLVSKAIENVHRYLQHHTTDLNASQLARHRRMNHLIADQLVRRHGAFMKDAPGPAATVFGNVILDADFNKAVNKTVKEMTASSAGATPQVINSAKRSIVEHELGEAAMLRGAAKWLADTGQKDIANKLLPANLDDFNKARKEIENQGMPALSSKLNLYSSAAPVEYKPKPIASHLGPAAILAENQALYRDPKAYRFTQKIRTTPEEVALSKKILQYGGTPNSPLPLGGKAHAKLEQALESERFPIGGEQALAWRSQIKGSRIPKESLKNLSKTIDSIVTKNKDYEKDTFLRMYVNELKTQLQKLQAVAAQAPAARESNRDLMALLSATRLDSSPGLRIK